MPILTVRRRPPAPLSTTPARPPRPAARRPAPPPAAGPPDADVPGLALAKSGNSFEALKDIEAIQEVLPHR